MVLEQTLLKQECLVCLGVFSEVFIYLFIFGCAGSSFRVWAFSSCGEWGYSPGVVHSLLIVVASLVAEHGLWGT